MRLFSELAPRTLEVAGDRPPHDARDRLRAFRLLLLAHLTTELTISFLRWNSSGPPVLDPLFLALGASVALVLAIVPRVAQYAAPAATLILGYAILRYFPNVANHTFLLFLMLLTLSIFDHRNPEEREACLQSLRWILAIVLFSTGVQKLLHGTYFHGEFLAFQVAHADRFATALRFVIDPAELERLRALGEASGAVAPGGGFAAYQTGPPPAGSGPYRFEGTVPLVVSNAVWIFEMLAPVLLLVRRTRTAAVAAVVAFLLFVELGAYEVMFGVLFTSSMLLFLRGNWIGKLLPLICAAYVYLIGVRAGWLPQWFFN